jgi:repressor LexA
MSLSLRQEKILDFIRRYSRERGFPPTIREIGKNVGISSTSVVNYNLNVLQKKQLITRDDNVARGLRLVESEEERGLSVQEIIRIPMLGHIVAGLPIPGPEDGMSAGDAVDVVELATGMLTDTEGVYALTVDGDSMIDALINSGDTVLLKEQKTARNGDMVAAWLRDEKETTLKHFYLEGDRVRLQPANPSMDPIYAPASNVEIQGKVIMVLRRMN